MDASDSRAGTQHRSTVFVARLRPTTFSKIICATSTASSSHESLGQFFRRSVEISAAVIVHECIKVASENTKLTPRAARRKPTGADPATDRPLCDLGELGGTGGRQELGRLRHRGQRATHLIANKLRDQLANAAIEIAHVNAPPAARPPPTTPR
jgi:hypothetical protein